MELKERTNYPYQQYPVRYPYEIFRARARQDDRPPVNPAKYDSMGPPGGDAQNSSFDFFKKFGQPTGKPNFKRTLMLNDRFDTKMKDHHWIQSKSFLQSLYRLEKCCKDHGQNFTGLFSATFTILPMQRGRFWVIVILSIILRISYAIWPLRTLLRWPHA